MTLKEAQTLTLRILKQVMEEKLDRHNVQLAQVRLTFLFLVYPKLRFQVTKDKGFEILDETSLKAIIDEM